MLQSVCFSIVADTPSHPIDLLVSRVINRSLPDPSSLVSKDIDLALTNEMSLIMRYNFHLLDIINVIVNFIMSWMSEGSPRMMIIIFLV